MYYYSAEDLRNIILNAHKIKQFNRCNQCQTTGVENWDDDGEDVKPGYGGPERTTGVCQCCDGVGFIDITMYEDEGEQSKKD